MTEVGSLFQIAFERSTVPTAILDNAGRVIEVNGAYLEISGWTRDHIIGTSTVEFIHAEDLPAMISGLDQLMGGARAVRHRRRHRRVDGTWIPVEVSTCLMANPDDADDHRILVQFLSHQVHSIEIDSTHELLNRQLFQPVGDAACVHDTEGRVVFASSRLEDLLGRPHGWMSGRLLTDPELDAVDADGSPSGVEGDPVLCAIRSRQEVAATLGVRSADGRRVWLSVVAGWVEREALPARSSLRDITDLIEAQQEARRLAAIVEEQLAYRANHDDLTGLVARRIVLGQMEEDLAAGRPVSVVFIDLDGFKAINDELGHLAGDDLLVAVADRLRGLAGPPVTVGRAGGDEFVAVTFSIEEANRFAAQVRVAAQSSDGLVPGASRIVRASVGVAHSVRDDTRTSLLTRADRAMYDAKLGERRST